MSHLIPPKSQVLLYTIVKQDIKYKCSGQSLLDEHLDITKGHHEGKLRSMTLALYIEIIVQPTYEVVV